MPGFLKTLPSHHTEPWCGSVSSARMCFVPGAITRVPLLKAHSSQVCMLGVIDLVFWELAFSGRFVMQKYYQNKQLLLLGG